MLLKVFIFWRLSLLFLTYLGSIAFPLLPNNGPGSIGLSQNFNYLASWAQWDGGHYLSIAQNGYKNAEDFAFFPLYPFLVSLLGKLFGNYLISGLLISNILFLVFLYLFYNFVKKYFSKNAAKSTVFTLLFFPTSFFAVAFYSESLFLLLTICAFYLMYDKKYLKSAFFVNLASLTRVFGVLLTISLVYSYLAKTGLKLKNLKIGFILFFLSLLSFGSYLLFQRFFFADAFKFLNSQILWQRSLTDPISTITFSIYSVFTRQKPIIDYADLFSTLLFALLLILGRRKIPSSLWVFSFLVLLLPASTGTLTSMPRYLLSSLGAFVILGNFLEKRRNLQITVWAIFLILQSFLSVRFINGYWAS